MLFCEQSRENRMIALTGHGRAKSGAGGPCSIAFPALPEAAQMGVGVTAPVLVQINRTAQPLTTDTPSLRTREPALSCSGFHYCLCSRLSTRFQIPSAFPRLGLNSQQVKTNPAPDKPLALKSRGVVELTANEGWGTRNKSSNPDSQ